MMKTKELEKIRTFLESGKTDEARTCAHARDTRSIQDASVHLQWADVLEELELYDDVLIELNLAARDDPGNSEICHRLADTYIDHGDVVKAARCLWAMVRRDPENIDNYKEIGHILEQAGHYDKALIVYDNGYKKTNNTLFKKLISSLDALKDSPIDETIEKGEQIVPSRNDLVIFNSLFASREGVYARQWASSTGETGYTPVHEPLTLKVAENHILGNLTAGVYPVRMDNTVNFIAFDLDLPKFVINKVITRESLWNRAMDKLHRTACHLIDLGAAHEIPLYLEDSGFKGRHCWIFLDTPVPASVAKKFASLLVGQYKEQPHDVSIEAFPKQATVRKGNLGNLIKLPLGFHRKTGKRSLFLNPDGSPVKDQLKFLDDVEKISRKAVYSLIQRLQSKPVSVIQESPPVTVETESVVTYTPDAYPYDLEKDPQVQYLLLKCPVLKRIVEKINRESTITQQETIVLSYTIGHLDNGPDAFNQLLKRCVNANPSSFLKSRFKGNPVSCPKIRKRIPEITSAVACNCTFDPSINMYPTPLIHIQSMSTQNITAPIGITVESMQFQNILNEYLQLRKQAREIDIMLKKYETQLQGFFENAGVELMETPLGKLRQIKEKDNRITFTLEMDGA